MSDCKSLSYNNLYFAVCVKPSKGKAPLIDKTVEKIESAKFVLEINEYVEQQKNLISTLKADTNLNTHITLVNPYSSNIVTNDHSNHPEFRETIAKKLVHFLTQSQQRMHFSKYVEKESEINGALAELINSCEDLSTEEKITLQTMETLDLDDEYFYFMSNIQEEKEQQQLMTIENVQKSVKKGTLTIDEAHQLVLNNPDNTNKLIGENSLNDAFSITAGNDN